MSVWSHDALQNDLAVHLHAGGARMLWTDITMGEAGSPRPDVLAMSRYSWALELTAFEVKVSASDFRSDSAAKEAFMAAKKVALATTIKGVIGVEPTEWETRQAPESERSGNA